VSKRRRNKKKQGKTQKEDYRLTYLTKVSLENPLVGRELARLNYEEILKKERDEQSRNANTSN